jgi:hypothetical protein
MGGATNEKLLNRIAGKDVRIRMDGCKVSTGMSKKPTH